MGNTSVRIDIALATLILVLGLVLSFSGLHLLALDGSTTQPPAFAPLVGLATSAVGLAVLIWWAASLLLAVLGEVLAARGMAVAARRVRPLTPQFMRRIAGLALGMNLLAGPAYAADWPAPSISAGEVPSTSQENVVSPLWAPRDQQDQPPLDPSWRVPSHPVDGGLLVKEIRESDQHIDSPEVAVRPGDSLWSIAARHLGPTASDAEIAEAWPSWYAANKQLIGDEPDLLQPGQLLQPPTPIK